MKDEIPFTLNRNHVRCPDRATRRRRPGAGRARAREEEQRTNAAPPRLLSDLPQFNAELSNITLRPELTADLDVPCGVRGKPPPKVTWLYNGSTVLPPGVRVRDEPTVIVDKVATVTKRLLWSPTSTLEQRKHTTGMYTCLGRVINRENRQRVFIDVQCKSAFKTIKKRLAKLPVIILILNR